MKEFEIKYAVISSVTFYDQMKNNAIPSISKSARFCALSKIL